MARVGVHAVQGAYFGVKINGVQRFWGPMAAGTYKTWSGKSITISTRRGNAFRIHADGALIGMFSRKPVRVHAVITPNGFKRIS